MIRVKIQKIRQFIQLKWDDRFCAKSLKHVQKSVRCFATNISLNAYKYVKQKEAKLSTTSYWRSSKRSCKGREMLVDDLFRYSLGLGLIIGKK